MADRLPHDHPDVGTVRAELARVGRTGRPRVAIPPDDGDRFPEGEVVRLVLDGEDRFVRPERELGGDRLELDGAYATPGGARDPASGTDHLPDWQDDHGVPLGGSVLVDVVAEGYRYGLRAPGERAVYDAGRPDPGLRDIARDLAEGGGS